MMDIELINGDMLEELGKMKEKSIDCIITDPPYELNFMNKGWDNAGISFQKETWEKCLRVLKPGGYLLAFGGSRTFHRIACAIEDVGFEIRDTIMWIYGSGFPKSMNIGLEIDKRNGVESPVIDKGKSGVSSRAYQSEETTTAGEYDVREAQNKWKGWGTCLKPSFEPIIIARKPFKGSLVDNVIKYGVGGINIDECRVETDELKGKVYNNSGDNLSWGGTYGKGVAYGNELGRFPANTILTYDQITFDEVCGGFPNTKGNGNIRKNNNNGKGYNCYSNYGDCETRGYEDSGSAARYFYCAKASKKDRNVGLEDLEYYALNEDIDENIKNHIKRLLNQ